MITKARMRVLPKFLNKQTRFTRLIEENESQKRVVGEGLIC